MEQEEENICDDVIYDDPGRRSPCRPKGEGGGGYLRGMHIEWGSSPGVTTRVCNLRGLISDIQTSTIITLTDLQIAVR